MRAEITQQNLYLIIAGKAAAVAAFIAEDEKISPLDALTRFYSSATYHRLECEDTKYWHYGPVALYQDYCYNNGQSCPMCPTGV
ncbi:MAG: hypothetical protein K5651_03610 [Bacteroidales bacterium]|nr:hypothetical protein [Bacteroidales bacterium]